MNLVALLDVVLVEASEVLGREAPTASSRHAAAAIAEVLDEPPRAKAEAHAQRRWRRLERRGRDAVLDVAVRVGACSAEWQPREARPGLNLTLSLI